jgi:hypothetical protein
LYSDLPAHLKHWRTDIAHLELFSNSDVSNALSWIKTNWLNLFNDYPDLSPGEITALNYYTTPEGNQINYWLRGDGVLPDVEWSLAHADNYLEFLDGAFTKLPHHSNSPTLLRGEIRAFSEMNSWTAGHQLDYPSFVSTAKDATGDFFDAGGFSHNVIININNSGNVKAINMESFSQLDTELEVLLFRGEKLELQGPPTLRRYPDENKVDEWMNNSFLSGELDAAGNPINPNYGTPDADKILMIDVNVID